MKELLVGIVMIVCIIGGTWFHINNAIECGNKGGRYIITDKQWPGYMCIQEVK